MISPGMPILLYDAVTQTIAAALNRYFLGFVMHINACLDEENSQKLEKLRSIHNLSVSD